METRQAEYNPDIARLAADVARRDAEAAKRDTETAKRYADYKTEIGRLAEDAAKRETRLVITVAGMLALAVAILGTLISFQN